MIFSLKQLSRAGLIAACLCTALSAPAQDAKGAAPKPAATDAPAMSVPAATPEAGAKVTAEMSIQRQLEARIGTKVEDFAKSPFMGLYEARINGEDMIYTDEKVSFIFLGSMIDARTGANLTKRRLAKLTAVNFDTLPLKDAIKLVNGTGKTRIAYFSDPNCPYCKRYEQTLSEMKDVTIYVFLTPILGDDSVQKAKILWCAPDRVKAWTDWMLRARMATARGCDTPIESNVALARSLNMRGTPLTILPDGVRLAGAVPKEQLDAAIAEATPK